MHRYEKKVKDFNFGSLIRTDSRREYAETNTIFGVSVFLRSWSHHLSHSYFYVVTRIQASNVHLDLIHGIVTDYTYLTIIYQFYAIEIARNRLGLNDRAHEMAKEEAEKEAKEKEELEEEKAKASGKSESEKS